MVILGMQKIDDTIYISNLPQDVTEEKLAAHFGSIGIIKIDKKLRKPKSKLFEEDGRIFPPIHTIYSLDLC